MKDREWIFFFTWTRGPWSRGQLDGNYGWHHSSIVYANKIKYRNVASNTSSNEQVEGRIKLQLNMDTCIYGCTWSLPLILIENIHFRNYHVPLSLCEENLPRPLWLGFPLHPRVTLRIYVFWARQKNKGEGAAYIISLWSPTTPPMWHTPPPPLNYSP